MFAVTLDKATCSWKNHAFTGITGCGNYSLEMCLFYAFTLGFVLFLLCVSFSSCNLDS